MGFSRSVACTPILAAHLPQQSLYETSIALIGGLWQVPIQVMGRAPCRGGRSSSAAAAEQRNPSMAQYFQ